MKSQKSHELVGSVSLILSGRLFVLIISGLNRALAEPAHRLTCLPFHAFHAQRVTCVPNRFNSGRRTALHGILERKFIMKKEETVPLMDK